MKLQLGSLTELFPMQRLVCREHGRCPLQALLCVDVSVESGGEAWTRVQHRPIFKIAQKNDAEGALDWTAHLIGESRPPR